MEVTFCDGRLPSLPHPQRSEVTVFCPADEAPSAELVARIYETIRAEFGISIDSDIVISYGEGDKRVHVSLFQKLASLKATKLDVTIRNPSLRLAYVHRPLENGCYGSIGFHLVCTAWEEGGTVLLRASLLVTSSCLEAGDVDHSRQTKLEVQLRPQPHELRQARLTNLSQSAAAYTTLHSLFKVSHYTCLCRLIPSQRIVRLSSPDSKAVSSRWALQPKA